MKSNQDVTAGKRVARIIIWVGALPLSPLLAFGFWAASDDTYWEALKEINKIDWRLSDD